MAWLSYALDIPPLLSAALTRVLGRAMNGEIFQLKELEIEPYQIREVLRCVLHTIMFSRALGLVKPRDIYSELFDINYVQCGDAAFEKKLEEKIDQLLAWVDRHPNRKSTVCLSFYETRSKQTAWFSSKLERLYWEQWYINLNTVQATQLKSKSQNARTDATTDAASEERSRRHAALESDLRDVVLPQVLQFVNEKKDHIPPFNANNQELIPFPYEITTPNSSDSSFGMDMFKRMLQTTPPTMLN